MNPEKFKKIKRVLAIIGVVLIVCMYLVSFVSSLANWEFAHGLFLASLYCTFVIPVIIYIIQMIYRLTNKNRDEEAREEKKTEKK